LAFPNEIISLRVMLLFLSLCPDARYPALGVQMEKVHRPRELRSGSPAIVCRPQGRFRTIQDGPKDLPTRL